MSEIFLKAKEGAAFIEVPCPLCDGIVGDAWQGTPVVACTSYGAVICRRCVENNSPLLLSLADLAHVVAVSRPNKEDHAPRVLKAGSDFRARVFDVQQATRLAFDLEHGIRKLDA